MPWTYINNMTVSFNCMSFSIAAWTKTEAADFENHLMFPPRIMAGIIHHHLPIVNFSPDIGVDGDTDNEIDCNTDKVDSDCSIERLNYDNDANSSTDKLNSDSDVDNSSDIDDIDVAQSDQNVEIPAASSVASDEDDDFWLQIFFWDSFLMKHCEGALMKHKYITQE